MHKIKKMRKVNYLLSITIAILLFSSSTQGQGIQFGVFFDPQLSWFTSDTKQFSPNGPVMGFKGGFDFEAYFADRYAIVTGVSMANLGGRIKPLEDYTLITREGAYSIPMGTSMKIRGQYLNVPLGFKFKTNEIGYTTFYAQLGAVAHMKMKAYVWEKGLGVDREVMDSKQLNRFFFSYMFGAGVQYSLGSISAVQSGLTFSNGLTSVLKGSNGMVSYGILSLRLGMVF